MTDSLPPGWFETTLFEVGKWSSGGTPSRRNPAYFGKGIPWVKSGDLPDGQILKTDEEITHKGLNNSSAKIMPPGTICMALYGATIGKLGIMTFPAATNQACANVVPDNRIVASKYLFQYLLFRRQDFIEQGQGGAQPNISQEIIRSDSFLLAPLSEQLRIAEMLESLLPKVDDCRSRLARVQTILKRFRQSVLSTAFSGRLTVDWRERNPGANDASDLIAELELSHQSAGGHKQGNAAPPTDEAHDLSADELPSSWCITDLRTAVCPDRPITYGILKPGPNAPDGIPYVRVADFPNDQLNLENIRRTTRDIEKAYARARLRTGDILLSIRGTVGRVVVVPPELQNANITQDTARVSIQPALNSDFVMRYLRSAPTQKRMQRAVKGVAVRGINIGDVRALQVPVPPRGEQIEIVRRVEALLGLADRIEARYKAVQQQVNRLPQSILAKAFRGELVPTEAELAEREGRTYESAEKLLDRIRRSNQGVVGSRDSCPRTSLNTQTIDGISLDGFSEPITIDELRQTRCAKVPGKSGIYVVIRPSDSAPHFLRKSTGGWFKGLDPSYPLAVVHENWVESAHVMYVGMTAADGGLKSRLGQFFDFGAGKIVGHRGGRLLWHLEDSGKLQVRWRTCAASKAESAEDAAIASFKSLHHGRPFAVST
jgi:type I restriction enzyme S subunit